MSQVTTFLNWFLLIMQKNRSYTFFYAMVVNTEMHFLILAMILLVIVLPLAPQLMI